MGTATAPPHPHSGGPDVRLAGETRPVRRDAFESNANRYLVDTDPRSNQGVGSGGVRRPRRWTPSRYRVDARSATDRG